MPNSGRFDRETQPSAPRASQRLAGTARRRPRGGEAAIVPLKPERRIVALALGGGGARGFAHVGVIKALEEAGIEAGIVIAVDVSWFAQARNAPDPGAAQYGRSGRYALLAAELDAADIVITPRTTRTRMLDFDKKEENIAAGEAAAREALGQIRERIAEAAARKRARGARDQG